MSESRRSSTSILLVDDDQDWLDIVTREIKQIESFAFDVQHATTVQQADELLMSGSFDICVIDIGLPDGASVDVVKTARSRSIPTTALIVTGSEANHELELRAVIAGASDMMYRDELGSAALERMLHMAMLRAEAETRQREAAIRDRVTGLYNRDHFDRSLKHEIERRLRHNDECSLLFIDLDNFKAVNDTYGHNMGDNILCDVASCLTQNIRNIDLAARFGSDEFVIMLPQTAQGQALVVAEKLLSGLNSIRLRDIDAINVCASIGLAGTSDIIVTERQLLDAADQACLSAKAAGKNRVYVHQ